MQEFNIEVGDRVTYKFPNENPKLIFQGIIKDEREVKDFKTMTSEVCKGKQSEVKILKIERPKYEVVEEKKY